MPLRILNLLHFKSISTKKIIDATAARGLPIKLHKEGFILSRARVARLMKAYGLSQ